MTEPAAKPARRTPALIAAFLAGAGVGGSGYTPHLIVHGDEPASGATCVVIGPALDGQRVCTPEAVGWGAPVEPTPAGAGTVDAGG